MNKQSLRSLWQSQIPFFVSVPAFVWVIIFFYIPVFAIVGRSLFIRILEDHNFVFSLVNYVRCLNWTHYYIIKRSLLLALCTACTCLVLAYPIAYFIARHTKKSKYLFLFLIMLPFSVNFLVQSYAWFFMLGNTGLINSLLRKLAIITNPLPLLHTQFAIYVGMIYCYVPFTILPLYTILDKLDLRLIEASLDLGASWFTTVRNIIVPLSMPGIKTGFFLVFIPAFGEFVIPALLGGGKQMYVGSLISYYFLTTRNLPVGSAFTCLSCSIMLLLALIINWWLKKRC